MPACQLGNINVKLTLDESNKVKITNIINE